MKNAKQALACCLIGALLLSACSIQKPENASSQGDSSWSVSSNASQNGGSSSKGSSSGGSNSSKGSSSGGSSSGSVSGTDASSKGGSSGASTSSKGSAGTNNGDDGDGNNGNGDGNNGGGTDNNGGGNGNNGGGTDNNGGGNGNNGGGTTTPPAEDHGAWDPGGDWGGSTPVYTNSAPGVNTFTDSYNGVNTVVDYSNAGDGYIMVKVSGSSTRVRAIVKGPGGREYYYTIPVDSGYTTIPLQMGGGTYTVTVAQETSGGFTPLVYQQTFSGSNTNWLRPSQMVDYSSSSSAIRKAYGLCMNATSDLARVKSIYNWIVQNISYDYGKASSVGDNYVPTVDGTYSSRSGICYDYAALMAAMLRSQDIPTKLVKGDAGGYHAWNEVYINGVGWITVRFYTNGGWQLMDTTYAAGGQEDFTLNSSNYTAQSYY